MGSKMRRLLSCIGLLLVLWPRVLLADDATEWKQAIGIPGFYGASDSEGFSTYKLSAGVYPLYEHGDHYTGVAYQKNYFSQNAWHSWADEAKFITKAINPRTALGYNLTLGYNQQNGFGSLTTDSQFGFSLTDATRLELILIRERVETQNAIRSNVYYTLPAVSLEYQLLDRLTIVAVGGSMFFSDANSRPLLRLKLIYALLPDEGVTAQLRYRQYRDSNTNVPNNYFNPANYYEGMFALGLRRRVSGWMLDGTAGIGRQSVNDQSTTMTELLEAGATTPFAGRVFFRGRLGYGRSSGFQAPNYSYQYLTGELIFPL